MSMVHKPAAHWRKSSYSGGEGGQCVELAALDDATVGIRDSKNPQAGHHTVRRTDLAGLIAHTKSGELDLR